MLSDCLGHIPSRNRQVVKEAKLVFQDTGLNLNDLVFAQLTSREWNNRVN